MEKGKSLPVVRWAFVTQLRHNVWGFSVSYLFDERSSHNESATNVKWNSVFSDAKKRNFLDIKVRARQKTLILHFLGILGAMAWHLEKWVSMDWSLEEILASNLGFSSPFSFPSLLFYDCAIICIYSFGFHEHVELKLWF